MEPISLTPPDPQETLPEAPAAPPKVRNWPIPAVGVSILLAFCALVVYEPRFLRAVALQTYDALLSATARPPASDLVVFVDVDEPSIKSVGQWPWSRHLMARLANRLWDAGAAVLVFDVGFPEPDRLSPANAFSFWETAAPQLGLRSGAFTNLPDFDSDFARALSRGPSVLGFYVDPSDAPLPKTPDSALLPWQGAHFEKGRGRHFLPQGGGIPNPPIPPLLQSARLGCFNATPDQDNIVRRAPLVFAVGPERTFFSLALEAVRLFLGDLPVGILYDSEGVQGVKGLLLGRRSVSVDANARLVLNFRKQRFPSIPAADVLAQSFDPSRVRGKIALVGSSAVGLFDVYSTPVHPELPGAEIQATIVDNLLAGDMLVEPRWLFFADLALLFFGGLALVAAVSRTRALLSFAILLLALCVPVGLCVFLLRSHHWVYLPGNVALGWALAVLGTSLAKYWQKEIIADFDARLRAVNLRLNREIAVRAAAEREALVARTAALRAAAAKSEFLANMSHEIRTPMNAVIGLADLALRAADPAKRRDHLAKISRSAHALLRIINDVLDFSKLEAGKLSIENTPFDLFPEIDELADLLGPQAFKKGVDFLVDCPLGTPRALVGDPLRLRQVLINLVGNAIKFTEKGSVSVHVETLSETPSAATLRFSVRDTGIGLDKEQRLRLFGAFQQADASTTRKYGGTGLGLAISQTLVRLMGGQIEIDSQPGVGSTFFFDVPFDRQSPDKETSLLLPEDLRGQRILLVGDVSPSLQLLDRACRFLGLVPDPTAPNLALPRLPNADAVVFDASQPGSFPFLQPLLDASKPLLLLASPLSTDALPPGRVSPPLLRLDLPLKLSSFVDSLLAAWGRTPMPAPAAAPPPDDLPPQADSLHNARVLLVDDNSINRDIAAENMAEFGISVDTAQNGQEAVDKTLAAEWDLILMDVQMPVLDGYQATRAIRDLERAGKTPRPRTPIVAMTANVLQDDQDKCLECGMDGFVAKPLERRPFLDVLLRFVSRDSQTAPAPLPAAPPAPPSPPSPPAFDEAAALDRLHGNRNLLSRLLDDFLRQHSGDPDLVAAALQSGDFARGQALAHAIKGSSANLGAMQIHRIAAELDSHFRRESLILAAALLRPLQAAFDDLRDLVAPLLPNDPSPPADRSFSPSDSLRSRLLDAAELLRQGDLGGLDRLDSLWPLLAQSGLPDPDLKLLRRTADAFDCARAAELLAQFLSLSPAPSTCAKPHPTEPNT